MRELGGLLVIAVSVGLTNFAGAIGIGLSGVDARTRLRVGLAFGFFEAAMPIAGLLIGQTAAGAIGGAGRYVGGALLVLTGAWGIYQGRRTSRQETEQRGGLRLRQLLVLAAALSLDNLVVGFALGVYRVPLAETAVVIGAVSVGLSLLGLELGQRLGARIEEWSEELGGAVLVLIGLALAFGLLK
ncbi:MAG TPA: manganese efflux pump [Candidatus Dormibacteraeota bacterium]